MGECCSKFIKLWKEPEKKKPAKKKAAAGGGKAKDKDDNLSNKEFQMSVTKRTNSGYREGKKYQRHQEKKKKLQQKKLEEKRRKAAAKKGKPLPPKSSGGGSSKKKKPKEPSVVAYPTSTPGVYEYRDPPPKPQKSGTKEDSKSSFNWT